MDVLAEASYEKAHGKKPTEDFDDGSSGRIQYLFASPLTSRWYIPSWSLSESTGLLPWRKQKNTHF